MKKMKAIQLFGKEQLHLVDVAKPTAGDNEVVIQVKAASICGTDVRMYKNGYVNVDENNPLTLGHEVSGVISEIGQNIKAYAVGDRVAIAPNMGCGVCDQCVSGRTHLCPDYEAFGINLPGGFAEYMLVTEKAVRQGNITLLGTDISFEEAALIEPFSCVYNGQSISTVQPADDVLIIGSGPIGIMHAMLAYSQGAGRVIMNDLQADRLAAAKELIPELITLSSENLAKSIQEMTGGRGVDLCVIAAPAPQAQEASFEYMAMNGRLLFFGGLPKGKEMVSLNTNLLHYKQLRLFGCTRASLMEYRTSERLVASGRVPLGKLITNRVKLADYELAFSQATQAIGLKNVFVFE